MKQYELFGIMAQMIIERGAKKVTQFISDKEVLKGTRRGKLDKRQKSQSILFTIGSPNYVEREIMKREKKHKRPIIKLEMIVKWPKK